MSPDFLPNARLDLVLSQIIRPVLAGMASTEKIAQTPAAERLMLAIGWQESRFLYRDQVDTGPAVLGPATGFWQFESGGGVRGVMRHHASSRLARYHAAMAGLPFDQHTIWAGFAQAKHDYLAAAFARLLLWTDPKPLPEGEAQGWDYYLRTWRPGKPHARTWPEAWKRADDTIALAPLP
jgi:hypothetical protein